MIKIKHLLAVSLFCFCLVRVSFGQITQNTLPVKGFGIINFHDLAQKEAAHPPKIKGHRNLEADEDEHTGVPTNRPLPVDAVHTDITIPQTTHRSPMSPLATNTFTGMTDNGAIIPPDVDGVVGPGYVMEGINTGYRVSSKTGTTVSNLSLASFWSGVSSSGSPYCDPHMQYDANNQRWITCLIANLSNGHYGLFIAVSQTSDPTGSWYEYSIDTGSSTTLPDYPLMGYNVNWVALTVNNFANGNSFSGTGIYIMNRASLYSGTLGTVTTATDASSFAVAPAQTMDNTTTTLYMLQEWNGASGSVRFSTITGAVNSPVYTLGTTITTSNLWSETVVNAPQSGTTNKISTNDTRMHSVIVRNGSVWAVHTIYLPSSSPTRSSIQWWQINPSNNTVQQAGRVDDASGVNFYAFPSMAVDANNDVMIGYSAFSSSTFASAGFSYRAGTDAANTIQTPTIYKAGQSSYYKTFGGSTNRWGDYSMTSLDPTDGSFWTLEEFAYSTTANTWGTQWAQMSVAPPCNAPTGMTTSAIGNNTATFSWTNVSGAGSYNVQYRPVGTPTWTSVTNASNPYVATGLTAGTNYEWQVQTVCTAGGNSSFTSSTTFTTTGTAPCNTPTGEATSSITSTSAVFSWTTVSNATGYNVQYRLIGGPTWTSASTTTTSYSATGLSVSSNYEWQVMTSCTGGGSSLWSGSTNFSTPAVSYCSSTGGTLDGITNVTFNTINNTTSSTTSGYTDYTGSQSTTVNQGSAYTLSVKINTGGNYTNYTKAWIDWNHDGTFSTSTEEYNLGTATNVTSGLTSLSPLSITVPATAVIGTTRMRVSTQYNTNPTPCNASFDGEVEDYSVVVAAPTGCGTPSGLSSSGITGSSGIVSWSAVSGALSYNLQWKLSTSGTWTTISGITATSDTLTGLTSCSTYNYQVQAVCSSGTGSYSSASSFTTTGCTITYCTSKGTNTSREYINRVALGTINNTSGNNNGYADYTSLSTSLTGSTAYTITLVPGYTSTSRTEYWKVYIDYNHNGVFTDAGENVVSTSGKNTRTATFTVPASALNGATRMRVQMEYNTYPSSSCATFTNGEVEDYTVNITGNSQVVLINPGEATITITPVSSELVLYPNPAHDQLSAAFTAGNASNASIHVYNLMGQAVLTENYSVTEGANKIDLNTSSLSSGVYIFEMMKDGEAVRQRFVISK